MTWGAAAAAAAVAAAGELCWFDECDLLIWVSEGLTQASCRNRPDVCLVVRLLLLLAGVKEALLTSLTLRSPQLKLLVQGLL